MNLGSKLKGANGRELVAVTLCTMMGNDCKTIMNSLPTLRREDKKNPEIILVDL